MQVVSMTSGDITVCLNTKRGQENHYRTMPIPMDEHVRTGKGKACSPVLNFDIEGRKDRLCVDLCGESVYKCNRRRHCDPALII